MNVSAVAEYLAVSPPTAVSWIAYILIGAIAGWLAGKIVQGHAQGILLNIAIGVLGGYVGGMLLTWLGVDVENYKRIYTFFLALGGAVLLLWLLELVRKP
jgi:uncharacterized membrane protein YeaQ/YmgE (transglycosylase-associated protein family)